jgi:aryl-alcohol dehydrogenase-like predicted oxidoreductase
MSRWQGTATRRVLELATAGVVGALGTSVYAPEEAIACLADKRVTYIQIPFNLLDARWLNRTFLKALAERADVQVHARSVFLQGLLINQAAVWPEWVEKRDEYTRHIATLVRKWGRRSAADLCIAYVRSFAWVTTLVLGAETLRQATELMSLASEPALTPDQAVVVQTTFAHVPMRLLDPSQWLL